MKTEEKSLYSLFNGFTHQIWGLHYSDDLMFDDQVWRGVNIKKVFYFQGSNTAGINIRFLKDCWATGVNKLVLFIGYNEPYKEQIIDTPTPAIIKILNKKEDYENKPSKFDNGDTMRIYYIKID